MISSNFKTNQAKIAVFPFSTNEKEKVNFSESDKFIAYCMEMGFTVVERKKLQEILDELKLELTGSIKTSDINKIGKILEIDIIVFGNLQYRRDNGRTSVSQTIRFVDIKTGEVLISADATSSNPDNITKKLGIAINDRIIIYLKLMKRR
jgi:curli biogenesis system outer membrane secretion channel CsgG